MGRIYGQASAGMPSRLLFFITTFPQLSLAFRYHPTMGDDIFPLIFHFGAVWSARIRAIAPLLQQNCYKADRTGSPALVTYAEYKLNVARLRCLVSGEE